MAYARSLFSGALNLKLIQLVKDNPVLYNPSHPKYTSFYDRDAIWRKIGETLQIPARKCKERWLNLKDTMRKKIASRQQNSEQQHKFYRYEEELAFMIPFFKELTNDHLDSFEENTEADSPITAYNDEALNSEEKEYEKGTVAIHKVRDNDIPRYPNCQMFNPVFSQKLNTSDHVDVFLMTMRSTLRKLHPYYLNQAKSEIFQIVQAYELKQIGKGQSNT